MLRRFEPQAGGQAKEHGRRSRRPRQPCSQRAAARRASCRTSGRGDQSRHSIRALTFRARNTVGCSRARGVVKTAFYTGSSATHRAAPALLRFGPDAKTLTSRLVCCRSLPSERASGACPPPFTGEAAASWLAQATAAALMSDSEDDVPLGQRAGALSTFLPLTSSQAVRVASPPGLRRRRDHAAVCCS